MNREKISAFVGLGVLLITLLACAGAQSSRVVGPDGKVWISIECRRSQTNCYEEAGTQCPRGYIIANSDGEHGTAYVSNYNQYGGYTIPIHTFHGQLFIQCK